MSHLSILITKRKKHGLDRCAAYHTARALQQNAQVQLRPSCFHAEACETRLFHYRVAVRVLCPKVRGDLTSFAAAATRNPSRWGVAVAVASESRGVACVQHIQDPQCRPLRWRRRRGAQGERAPSLAPNGACRPRPKGHETKRTVRSRRSTRPTGVCVEQAIFRKWCLRQNAAQDADILYIDIRHGRSRSTPSHSCKAAGPSDVAPTVMRLQVSARCASSAPKPQRKGCSSTATSSQAKRMSGRSSAMCAVRMHIQRPALCWSASKATPMSAQVGRVHGFVFGADDPQRFSLPSKLAVYWVKVVGALPSLDLGQGVFQGAHPVVPAHVETHAEVAHPARHPPPCPTRRAACGCRATSRRSSQSRPAPFPRLGSPVGVRARKQSARPRLPWLHRAMVEHGSHERYDRPQMCCSCDGHDARNHCLALPAPRDQDRVGA